MLWIGIDVGGTFTDGVAYDDRTRTFAYAKAPSTPGAPTQGVLAALDLLGGDMAQVARFCHGVTIGTNAILEKKGAEVWMLVTQGFRDVLEIGRTNRPVLYDLRTLKTPPLVPRLRTLEVAERLMFDGSVRTPLDPDQVRAVLTRVPTGPDVALAVCFLHAYANPAHEQAVKHLAQATHPGWFVCASEEVSPQFREVERFNTTVLNAYIGPLMARYLDALREGLAGKGYRRDVFIMTSNGGVATAEQAKRLPVGTVLSGPAGGVAASVHLGKLRGIPNLITCDMGGTSTDVCLIEGLRIPVTNEQRIGAYANRTPQIEINAVGAGGGSIAWLDDGDILKVGPQSAGADPGPACYGRGGTEPTVTDANLVLKRLAGGGKLAGKIDMDPALAEQAVARLGARVGLDARAMADGIIRIAVANMVSAIKQISISNGYDPRDFVLLPYGGAGPMHAAAIADELEMARILVPVGPGNFAAFGSLISDLRRDHARTRTGILTDGGYPAVDALFQEIEAKAGQDLLDEGVAPDRIVLKRSAGMRYLGQSWELLVELPETIASIPDMEAAFAEVHDRRFGHRSGGAVEIVNYRVTALGVVDKPELPPWTGGGDAAQALAGARGVWFDGRSHDTPIYRRERLAAGVTLEGPAIIDESGSTTLLPPKWSLAVLDHGDLLLEKSL
ncbi:MAG TPA: hydantoinase/oxoprolinase family protein [Rhodopila sp.]|uniref:hydantoinase/oxoprolinase family protein n=1 Tax=Rhodopila sp. TaxID=2480087 RepID=UPI002CBB76D3|nr:hydantoinase/oxoprolinase family protein [Rhodopila sp.]HVY14241.1 hydantoinase/oxoprolinase family protein [Rhodopila sp.]